MLELQWRAYAEEGGTMCGWDDECQRGPHPLPPGLVVQDVWKRKHFTWKGPRKKTMLRRSKLFVKTMWWKKQLARMWGLWLQRVTIGGFEGVWEIWEMGSDWRRGVGGWFVESQGMRARGMKWWAACYCYRCFYGYWWTKTPDNSVFYLCSYTLSNIAFQRTYVKK